MEARGAPGKVLRKADVGRAKSQLSQEAEKRQSVADAPLTCRKRKRDADPEGDGSVSASGGEGPQLLRLCCLSPTMPPLQQLLNACRAVLTSCTPQTPPHSAAAAFVRGIMDKIGPNDVGLKDEIRFFHKMNMAGRQKPPIITCKPIYEGTNFTIAVFFLPLGAVIPIHDHPGITVFTKLLIGSAHLEAYDWVCPRAFSGGAFASSGSRRRMLAQKVRDHSVIAGASDTTWVLFPNHGVNMLRFTAAEETHCAFLDVLLMPPDVDQRRCAYYQDFDEFPYEHHRPTPSCKSVSTGVVSGDELIPRRLAWLEEIPKPRDLRIVYLPYRRGPAVF